MVDDACLLEAVKELREAQSRLSALGSTVIDTKPGLVWGSTDITVREALNYDTLNTALIAQIAAGRAYNACMDAIEVPQIGSVESARIHDR